VIAVRSRVDDRGGCLLEHLLVSSLDRAVPFAQVHRVPMRVGEDLDLHVARPLQVLLDVQSAVAERPDRLLPGEDEGSGEFCR